MLSNNLVNAINAEQTRAAAAHGPFPRDLCRGLALLTEELGEAAAAVLSVERAERDGQRYGAAVACDEARAELIQLMAVAAQLHDRLVTYGVVVATRPATPPTGQPTAPATGRPT